MLELVFEDKGDVMSDNVLVRPLFVDVSVFIIIKKYINFYYNLRFQVFLQVFI